MDKNKFFIKIDWKKQSTLSEKRFLAKLIGLIEYNVEESRCDMQFLSFEMNMSKSTLYRKIKIVTGQSPLLFIRDIRMQKARILLSDRILNISEIAYNLGFNCPKYFSICFKKEFGLTPTEFRNTINF